VADQRQSPAPIEYRWIDEQDDLDGVVAILAGQERYALDTEFHRERTYYPKLALIQVAWAGEQGQQLALIDPLRLDVTVFEKVFSSDALCVIHAAQQDLDVLTHACGTVPRRIFDTQLAAGFTGYGTPSLVALLQGEIGVTPAKGDRLTDWLRRPLSEAQCQYAAVDVEYLLEVETRLRDQLEQRGRLEWAEAAIGELQSKPVSGSNPDDAWLRLKDTRSLRPTSRAVARSVAGWRERRAMRTDIPVRQVLPDLAILGVSQRAPTTLRELSQSRGIDDRHSRGGIAEEILAAVAEGKATTPPEAPRSNDDLDRNLRPAVALITAWVGQLARDERIDTVLLATRADIVSLLRGDDDARLATGWRGAMLGDGIRDLVAGRRALTFDGEGRLELVPVHS
jgi:ribonuclease D